MYKPSIWWGGLWHCYHSIYIISLYIQTVNSCIEYCNQRVYSHINPYITYRSTTGPTSNSRAIASIGFGRNFGSYLVLEGTESAPIRGRVATRYWRNHDAAHFDGDITNKTRGGIGCNKDLWEYHESISIYENWKISYDG